MNKARVPVATQQPITLQARCPKHRHNCVRIPSNAPEPGLDAAAIANVTDCDTAESVLPAPNQHLPIRFKGIHAFIDARKCPGITLGGKPIDGEVAIGIYDGWQRLGFGDHIVEVRAAPDE